MMPTILLTGATGFVGSALAATLLARGMGVVAVSRRDPHGNRTRAAVRAAARGCGITLDEAMPQLRIVDAGEGGAADALKDGAADDIAAVWHCAADMGHSGLRIAQSFDTNVCETTALYRWAARQAPRCQRFYHVSTAYTAGMRGGHTEERLHAGERLLNAYQISKWSAEHALRTKHDIYGLPVTLFRPTIVVGHSRSGWTPRNRSGFYMFVEAVEAVRLAGLKRIAYDLPDDVCIDLLPLDWLVDDAAALTLRSEARGNFEVFHCAGGRSMTSRAMLSMMGELLDVQIDFAPMAQAADFRFARAVAANHPFEITDWDFCRARLDGVLGTSASREPVSPAQLRALLHWYIDAGKADIQADAMPRTGTAR